jgi:hypothetical protein
MDAGIYVSLSIFINVATVFAILFIIKRNAQQIISTAWTEEVSKRISPLPSISRIFSLITLKD